MRIVYDMETETNSSPTLWMTSTGWVHADKACAESRRNSQGATRAPADALSKAWAKPCKKCLPAAGGAR